MSSYENVVKHALMEYYKDSQDPGKFVEDLYRAVEAEVLKAAAEKIRAEYAYLKVGSSTSSPLWRIVNEAVSVIDPGVQS